MSNRKPYVREMTRTWWKDSDVYRLYMLREATVLPLIFFTFFLALGLASLVMGEGAWINWLDFMQNPLVVAINIVALAGSLYHAYTFFNMMPKVMPIRIKGKLLEAKQVVAAQWTAVAVISVIVLMIV